ncbi:MAG: ATP-binding protein, partial [Candidatus Cloacimonas sp.]
MSTNITNISRVVPPPHGYINEIAKILGCHRVTVSNALKKNAKGILAEQARQIYKIKYGMDSKEFLFQNEEKEKRVAELIMAKEHAEESNRLKTAFLANMSHEIRTPMNGILGFTELMKNPKLTAEEQQKYISIIEKSGVRMLNIVNDIISISKLESGQMEICISETNINEQTEYIFTFFKPEAEQKGIKIFLKNSLSAQQATIKTDREKFYAILTNLVKNAIKYSDKGSIRLGYEKKGKYLEFFVKDTGIGIPKDMQKAVFNRFIQADSGDKRAFQGAGLGLSISKAYVEMLGGEIRVESEEGKGSIFYFTIPYNKDPEEKVVVENIVPADETENHVKSLKILIADDDEISEMLITRAIKI